MSYIISCSTKNGSTIFAYFSWHLLLIWYGARCVDLIVPLGRRDALFFLRAQLYTFSSTLIKKIKTFV